jgi:outer membrane protein OmpA-like peptidoglycan-associated protein
MAYRNPQHDRLNALLRYEYRQNPSTIPETLLIGRGTGSSEHLLATELIYAPNWQWEFYAKAGVRFATSTLAQNYTARSTIALTQLRATYRINRRLDVVGEARWIGQPSANYTELGFLGEVGYHLTPNIRLAAGYSSGSINSDRDFSGSRSEGGVYGGVTVKLDRLFEGFGLQKPLPAPEQPKRIIRAAVEDGTLQAALPTDTIQLNLSQTLEFAEDSAALTPASMVVLDSLATLLTEYPSIRVDLQAHLGAIATLNRNAVEVQQMQIARSYLLQQGVNGNQLVVRSLGGEAITDQPIGLILSATEDTFAQLSARLADPTQDLLDKVLPILESAETAAVPSRDPREESIGTTAAIIPPESLPPISEVSREPTPADSQLLTEQIADPITNEPFATAQPVPLAPQALLPTFLLESVINPNDRLPHRLIPTLLSLTLTYRSAHR